MDKNRLRKFGLWAAIPMSTFFGASIAAAQAEAMPASEPAASDSAFIIAGIVLLVLIVIGGVLIAVRSRHEKKHVQNLMDEIDETGS